MPKKHKQKREARILQEQKARRARTHRRVFGAVVVLLVIGMLGYHFVNNPPPYDWVQCFPNSSSKTQHSHYSLYMQVGEEHGSLNVSFIRIPEQLGVSVECTYPVHTHNERDSKYTKIHVHAPNDHTYTLNDLFVGWSNAAGYPANIYFGSDGISYFRTGFLEMRVNGVALGNYPPTYTPPNDAKVDLIIHEPYEVVPGPYPGGSIPLTSGFSVTTFGTRTVAFEATASGGTAPYTYTWDFGDGTTGVGQTIQHTYENSGSYFVIMRTTDAVGIVGRATRTVVV